MDIPYVISGQSGESNQLRTVSLRAARAAATAQAMIRQGRAWAGLRVLRLKF